MSSVVVVRRYKCWEGQDLKKIIHQEGILQICGPSDAEMLILSDNISTLASYKLACNCRYCLSYKEESRVEKVMTEPLMRAVAMVFNILCKFGYTLKSSTAVQNQDGSNSTTWVWIKKPKVSNI